MKIIDYIFSESFPHHSRITYLLSPKWIMIPRAISLAGESGVRKVRPGILQPINSDARVHVAEHLRSPKDGPSSLWETRDVLISLNSPEPFHRSHSHALDSNLDNLPLNHSRAFSDPSRLALEDDLVLKDPVKRRFSLVPLSRTGTASPTIGSPTMAVNTNWRPFPLSTPSPVSRDGSKKIHPIVAALQSMRRRSADNMVITMALTQKLETSISNEVPFCSSHLTT